MREAVGTAGPREACDQPLAHGIGGQGHDDRDGRARIPGCPSGARYYRNDDVHLQIDEFDRERGEPLAH